MYGGDEKQVDHIPQLLKLRSLVHSGLSVAEQKYAALVA